LIGYVRGGPCSRKNRGSGVWHPLPPLCPGPDGHGLVDSRGEVDGDEADEDVSEGDVEFGGDVMYRVEDSKECGVHERDGAGDPLDDVESEEPDEE